MFANKKIMLVLPERLGDTLMTTPAIHYLKHYYPSSQIDVICLSTLSADTVKNNPDIRRVFITPSEATLKELAGQYDYGINIHDDPTNPITREQFLPLKLNPFNIPMPDAKIHQAEQALLFMQTLLPEHPPILERHYRLFPQTEDFQTIEHLLQQHHVDLEKDILIGCHLGCHSIAKRGYKIWRKPSHPKVWPFENVVRLEQMLRNYNPAIRLVLTGSKSEQVLGNKLSKKSSRVINLIDQTSVLQLAALMRYLKLFITPDTGVMHVACGTQVALVALFGPTSLQRTGPYPVLDDLILLQARTMSEITVDDVYQAVVKKLKPLQ